MAVRIFTEADLINIVVNGPTVNAPNPPLTETFAPTVLGALFNKNADASGSNNGSINGGQRFSEVTFVDPLIVTAEIDLNVVPVIPPGSSIQDVVVTFDYSIVYDYNGQNSGAGSAIARSNISLIGGDDVGGLYSLGVIDSQTDNTNPANVFNNLAAQATSGSLGAMNYATFVANFTHPKVTLTLGANNDAGCGQTAGASAITDVEYNIGFTNWQITVTYTDPDPTLLEVTGEGGVEINSYGLTDPLIVEGDGGVEVNDEAPVSDNEIIGEGGLLVGGIGALIGGTWISGQGGLLINGAPILVLSVDVSGIYTLVPGKTNDTLYERQGSQDTIDVAIPDPFFKLPYLG